MRLKICSKENIEIYVADRKLLSGKKKKKVFFFQRGFKTEEANWSTGKEYFEYNQFVRQQGRKGQDLWRGGEKMEKKEASSTSSVWNTRLSSSILTQRENGASASQQVPNTMRQKKTILSFVICTHGFSLLNARCEMCVSKHAGISIIADGTTIRLHVYKLRYSSSASACPFL